VRCPHCKNGCEEYGEVAENFLDKALFLSIDVSGVGNRILHPYSE
jgi:hypothetical protein